MNAMVKKIQSLKLLAVVLALGFVGYACSSESAVTPRGTEPGLMAQGPGDTIHEEPDTICGTPVSGNLVDALGRAGSGNFFGADIYGGWELISTPNNVVLQVTLGRGWFVASASVYQGSGATIPRDNQGNIDAENLPLQAIVNPVRNIYEITWPIAQDMQCPNTVWTCARFVLVEQDFLGNPFNDTPVWMEGQIGDNSGSQYVPYCAESCGPPPPPPCVVPAPTPGSNLSAYYCGNGNGQVKVNVCHLPPGNPANMQEICIAVSALDAHILEFKPLNNPCMGHHSGCHIGPCDPCGPGSTAGNIPAVDPCPGNGGNGGNGGRNR